MIYATINAHDAVRLLQEVLTARFGHPVTGVRVMSWNQEVFTSDGHAIEFGNDVRHILRPEHAVIDDFGVVE